MQACDQALWFTNTVNLAAAEIVEIRALAVELPGKH
jgi:hypothetical protein